jgi:hypothetical protein
MMSKHYEAPTCVVFSIPLLRTVHVVHVGFAKYPLSCETQLRIDVPIAWMFAFTLYSHPTIK